MIVYILVLYTCCIGFLLFFFFFFFFYTQAARIRRSSFGIGTREFGRCTMGYEKEDRDTVDCATAHQRSTRQAGKAFWSLGGSLESKGRFSEGHV